MDFISNNVQSQFFGSLNPADDPAADPLDGVDDLEEGDPEEDTDGAAEVAEKAGEGTDLVFIPEMVKVSQVHETVSGAT